MKIGIIVPPKAYKRGFLLKRILRIISVEEVKNAANPFELWIARVPFGEEKLKRMSPLRLENLLIRAKNKLNRLNPNGIVYDEFIKDLCIQKSILLGAAKNSVGDMLFLRMMPDCIRETAKKCKINLLDTAVCIREPKAGRISEYLMQELCFDTKKIVLATKDKEDSQKVCDRFFEETGLFVKNVAFDELPPWGIVIDIEEGMVSFGKDLYVKAVDLGFKLGDCNVRQREILALLKGYTPQKLKWMYSYE